MVVDCTMGRLRDWLLQRGDILAKLFLVWQKTIHAVQRLAS